MRLLGVLVVLMSVLILVVIGPRLQLAHLRRRPILPAGQNCEAFGCRDFPSHPPTPKGFEHVVRLNVPAGQNSDELRWSARSIHFHARGARRPTKWVRPDTR